jgi:hypothetical protein
MASIALPPEQATTHLRAYLATALTGLPDPERERIFALCRSLRSMCRSCSRTVSSL